jgi:hypothetical protein
MLVGVISYLHGYLPDWGRRRIIGGLSIRELENTHSALEMGNGNERKTELHRGLFLPISL